MNKKKGKVWLYSILALLLLYKSVFNVFTGQYVLSHFLAGYDSSAQVRKFSLFYGVVLDHLILGKSLPDGPFFTADKVGIEYNLPFVLLGRLKITNLSLIKPRLHLIKNSGKWNFESIFPSSAESPPPDSEASSEEIRTWLPISAYLHLSIDDFDFQLEDKDEKDRLKLILNDLNLSFTLDTNRFTRIPLGPSIVKLVDTLDLTLNPGNQVAVLFQDSSKSLERPFRFHWFIKKDSKNLSSRLDMGVEKLQIKTKNKIATPFGFQIFYNLIYDPETEKMTLQDFNIFFNEDIWLEASGVVEQAMSDQRDFTFRINRSLIRLEPLEKVLRHLPGMAPIIMKGNLSLAPMTIRGKTENLMIDAWISGKGIYIKNGSDVFSIPVIDLKWTGAFDFTSATKETVSNPMPFIRKLVLEKIDLMFNGTFLSLSGQIIGTHSNLDFSFKNFRPELYSPMAEGISSGKLKIIGIDFRTLNVSGNIFLQSFRYKIDKSKSGSSSISLNLNTELEASNPFSYNHVFLRKLELVQSNQRGAEGLRVSMNGALDFGDKMDVKLDALSLKSSISELAPTLPISLRDIILPLKNSLGDTIQLNSALHYHSAGKEDLFSGTLNASFADMGIDDLKTDFSLGIMKDGRVDINLFKVTAFRNVLTAGVSGRLEKRKGTDETVPHLKMEVNVFSQKPAHLYRGVTFIGKIFLGAQIEDQVLRGNFIADKVSMTLISGKCPGPDCGGIYQINNMQANIPVTHDMSMVVTKGILDTDKTGLVRTSGLSMHPNFIIHSVIGSHPALKNTPFTYIANEGDQPGFSAAIQYNENVLRIESLKMRLLDGLVYGKNILLNTGSGNPQDMEYAATVQIRDIDLKQLMHQRIQKKIDDGKIKADINLSGRNLNDPIENLNLFFSVFQIGHDFSKSAMNVISPQNVVTDFIVDKYAINDINMKLSKGLVYASISFKKSILSRFIKVEKNKITQERMPLANFLRRARSEIGTYK